MIPMIQQALTMGYTTVQILKYISSKFKSAGTSISSARKQGYSDEDILKFLGGKFKPKNQKRMDDQLSAQEKYLKASGIKTKEEKKETRDKYLSNAIGLGATALGAYNMYQNYSGIANNLQSLLGQSGNNPQPTNPPIPIESPVSLNPTQGADLVPQGVSPQTPGQQIGQGIQSPITEALQPSNPSQIAQAAQAIPDQEEIPIFEQLLGGIDPTTLDPAKQQQLKFLSMISDQLQTKGKTLNDPEFANLAKKIKSVLQGKPGLIIEENARFQAGQDAKNANVKPLDIEENLTAFQPAKIENPQSIPKGESVITEDGTLAEVKGTSGNNFLIEENGKIRQVPMDSLRSQPEAIKKAKIVFDPSKIPEEDKSAALAISLPMPDRSSIINMFHDGSFYVYRRKDGKPIDESIIRRVIDGQDMPITSGETFMGAWNQDKGDSRGSAAFKELTSMAQDSTKEDDPSKQLVFDKVTDSYTHGYLKEFMKLLKETGKQFNAKQKKIKK